MSSLFSKSSVQQLAAWEQFQQQKRPSATTICGTSALMPPSSSMVLGRITKSNDPTRFNARSQKYRCAPTVFPGVRYVQLVLGTLYLSIILGCVICFNPAITVMMDVSGSPMSTNGTFANQSAQDFVASTVDLPLADQRFGFTNFQKSLLLAGTFGACLLQIVPIGYAMQKFGAKRTQLFVGISVSLATGLTPLAASISFYALFFARMVNGLAITNLFPVVGAICTNWAPQNERGVFLAILSGYIQLSSIISMPISGFLIDKFGWPSVFFVHSFLGFSLSIWWALFYRDDPMAHPLVGQHELAQIRSGKQFNNSNNGKPPYRQICSTASIWAIFCAVFGNFLIVQFFNTFLPMFLITSLHFTNSETGLLSALPLILQFFVKWLTGFVTDHLPSVKDINKVRFCNSAAFFGSALFFLLASLFSPEFFPRWTVVLCLILAIALLGMNSGGFFKSVVLVSAQFSPTVMAAVQFTLCATIFTFSFVVTAMTKNGGNFEEYRRVFWLYVCGLIVTNSVFVIFGSADPAKWTHQTPHQRPINVADDKKLHSTVIPALIRLHRSEEKY